MKTFGKVWIWGILGILMAVLFLPLTAEAARKEDTIYANNPYVTMSPDGEAFTLGLGVKGVTPYNVLGYTGMKLTVQGKMEMDPAPAGWHYYTGLYRGSVPVGYWQLVHPLAQCIHHGNLQWHDLYKLGANNKPCMSAYLPGWFPYCAWCGERIGDGFFYLNTDMAKSLRYIQSGSEYSNYFYLCPYSYTMEMGQSTNHRCRILSENRYRVRYHSGAPEAEGYMQMDTFFHNNATLYEEKSVTPSLYLSGNRFVRKGYVFAGWSTSSGGPAVFRDKEDWLTVQKGTGAEELEDDALLHLYAVWKPVSSELLVKPNGGTFRGKTGDTLLREGYGTTVEMGTPAFADLTVTLQGNGASEFGSRTLKSRRTFTEWKKSSPFSGSYDGEKKQYTFSSKTAGTRDTLTAAWTAEAVILPAVTRSGYALEGWYETGNGKRIYAGTAGDRYVPEGNVTLQAAWTAVDLSLNSLPVFDRNVNGGKGAVNLTWALGKDRSDVSYKLYRQKQGEGRKEIHSTGEFAGEIQVNKTFSGAGTTSNYQVPATGRYDITLQGAAGGSHGSNRGGAGGRVDLTLWLTQGQVLILETGKPGQNASGTIPATGGGATKLFLKTGNAVPELLAVAGGGGGANEKYAGGAGGSSAALRSSGATGEPSKVPTETMSGTTHQKTYASGGGSGYVGGIAGKVTYQGHIHNEATCGYHTHMGSETTGGPCYGDKHVTRHVHTDDCPSVLTEYCGGLKWDNAQKCYVQGFCPNCGVDESDGCHAADGHCVKIRSYNCSNQDTVTYSRDCGLEEGWQCGRNGTTLELVTSLAETYPSGGGSNYVAGRAPGGCYILYRQYNGTQNYGVNSGSGFVSLTSKSTGYRTDRALKGVVAADEAAPVIVSGVAITSAGTGKLLVSWQEPGDRGTEYRFLAECYDILSGRRLAVSNETGHVMTSGIAGYYVRRDASPTTKVTAGNATLQTGRSLTVAPQSGSGIYVHIAAADRAGNIGETVHITVNPAAEPVLWEVATKHLTIREDEHVHKTGSGEYFIRADGENSIGLTLEAEIGGSARSTYQIRKVTMAEQESGAGNETILPYSDPGTKTVTYSAGQLELGASGETYLKPADYVAATRTDSARKVQVTRELLPKRMSEGAVLRVYPEATATDLTTGREVVSDHTADLSHGIRLIADVTAPVIHGVQQAEALGSTIDRSRTPSAVVTFTAEDSGSGVDPENFYVILTNLDNQVTRRIDATKGKIRVELADPEDYLLSGDIQLTVHAEDHVGNVAEETVSFSEFDLETSVTRILEAADGISTFKRGESGVLHIRATGYADSVEVTFPKGLTDADPELNRTFDYSELPAYEQVEDYVFMIPLYPMMQEKDSFEISVTARKGDLVLTSKPRVHVLELDGSVLDEIVTSLR